MRIGLVAAMAHAAMLAETAKQPPAEVDRALGKTRAERRNARRALRSKRSKP